MKREQLGSIVFQTETVMKGLIAFGESKHAAKETFKKEYSGDKNIDKFMASFAKTDGIHAITTFKDYLRVAIDTAKFARENFGIKDIKNLTAEHIQSFLQSKIDEKVSKSTFNLNKSALEKFSTALERKFEKKFDFEIKNMSFQGKENLKTKERAGYHPYSNTSALINQIKNMNVPETYKVAIELTAVTGLRLHKSLSAGIKVNPNGILTTQSKGGRQKEMIVSPALHNKIANLAGNKGVFKLSKQDYNNILSELKLAAKATGQSYEACHGFRHSFFLQKSAELQKEGMSLKDSWNKVSKEELDHNRFVKNYTRG